MPRRTPKDCAEEVGKRAGRPRAEAQDELEALLDRAEDFEHDGLSPDGAYAKARDERLREIADQRALRRRAEIMDTRKEISRHRFYQSVADQIAGLPIRARQIARLGLQAARYGLEAKLVGVNLPFLRNRMSVDAQYVALRRQWVGGLAYDLEQAGLLKIFASRALEDKWTDELFELNKKAGGRPGVTNEAQALAIAKTIQKWQRESMGALNREGAWVRSYSDYVTRTSHDADKIHRAGPEQWIADTLPRLNLKRTFGTDDRERVRDALFHMWTPMATGDHFDYGRPREEPLYPNTARQASASRELHFKSGADWRAYNKQYGVSGPTKTVVDALSIAARRTALMREFGTRPRESYERDKDYLLARLKGESARISSRIGALEKAYESPAAGVPEREKLAAQIAELRARAKPAADAHKAFGKWLEALDNRFAQIDGTSMRPVDRARANTVANIMSVQRMSKLGNLFMTHFASLPTKSFEARYWGIPFAERFGSLFRGLTQGAEGSAKREAAELTLVAAENRLGHIMNLYDVADAPAGYLAQMEARFFQLTGVSAVIDNQRGDFEAMAAAHVGSKRGQDWAAMDGKLQRVLRGFGIGEAEWKALNGVAWTQAGGRTYLFPSDARKLSDDQIKAYLTDPAKAVELGRLEPTPEDVARGRDDLALALAAAYTDRSGYAIPMPSARIRAMLFGKEYGPGTGWNMAKKLLFQFKLWPADMIVRAWERELYGTIGDGRMDHMAGILETIVGGIVFGVVAEGIRDIIKGQDPMAKLAAHPLAAILAGAQRSGMGSIVGDYLLGQFDRHGLSAAANLVGPTFGQLDDLMDLLHAGGATKDGMLSAAAMRERGATAIKMLKSNTPFMNLWATHWLTDTLVWHRLQEWINPGYLARSERRQRDLQGTQYWVSPAKLDAGLMGRR